MKTWVLYKRKDLSGDRELTFGVGVWAGDRKSLSAEDIENETDYIATITPRKTIRDLAELVCEKRNLSIGFHDRIISEQSSLIPINNYMVGQVSDEQIEEFLKAYRDLGGAVH